MNEDLDILGRDPETALPNYVCVFYLSCFGLSQPVSNYKYHLFVHNSMFRMPKAESGGQGTRSMSRLNVKIFSGSCLIKSEISVLTGLNRVNQKSLSKNSKV